MDIISIKMGCQSWIKKIVPADCAKDLCSSYWLKWIKLHWHSSNCFQSKAIMFAACLSHWSFVDDVYMLWIDHKRHNANAWKVKLCLLIFVLTLNVLAYFESFFVHSFMKQLLSSIYCCWSTFSSLKSQCWKIKILLFL